MSKIKKPLITNTADTLNDPTLPNNNIEIIKRVNSLDIECRNAIREHELKSEEISTKDIKSNPIVTPEEIKDEMYR